MEPGEDGVGGGGGGDLVHPGFVMDEGDPLVRRPEHDAVGDGDEENQRGGGDRHVAAPVNGAEPVQEGEPQDAAAAAAAAMEEQALQRQVEEWVEKNQFGMLWEAMTLINILACYKKPDTTKMAEHKVFHVLYFGFALLKGAWLGSLGASPAILLNRVIGTSLLRQLLWFLWCFFCYAFEMHVDVENHVRTYCTEPRYPLLCFPLVVCPFSLFTFSVGYDAVSMCLFPLRAFHHFQHEKAQGAQDPHAVRALATRLLLHLTAGAGLYGYCLRVVQVHGPALASVANHTLRTIRGVGRGVEWLVLAALFFFLALASMLRAMRVAIVFVRRRRWGRLWRGRDPHAHIE